MKILLTKTLLCIGAVNLVGCQTTTVRKLAPIEVVPSTSLVVLSINWTEVWEDDYLKRMINGDDLEETLRELNIAGDQVSELVVFSDAQNQTGGSAGIILKGSYDVRALTHSLKQQGWSEQTYDGHKLYFNSADDLWFAPLRSGFLVAGTRAGVEGVIEVESDPQAGLTSIQPFDRLVARFGKKRYPISMVMSFPQALQDASGAALELSTVLLDFAGLGPLGELLNKIGFAKGLGYSISRQGSSFPVELVAIMKDEEAASFVSGTLNLLKGITSLLPQQQMTPTDREAMQAFQSLSVDRDGEILAIKFVMSEKDLMR